MDKTYETNFPHVDKKISICDSQISRITINDKSVQFYFEDGFCLIKDNQVVRTKVGTVTLHECDPEEFSCTIFKLQATENGAKSLGHPVSLNKLSDYLLQESKRIEVILELYDFNHLYWRGTFIPYKEDGLSDRVLIEICGDYLVTYTWE